MIKLNNPFEESLNSLNTTVPKSWLDGNPNTHESIFHSDDGMSKVAIYPVFPGVYLTLINLGCSTWPAPEHAAPRGSLLINYSLDGQCEFQMRNGNYLRTDNKDISIILTDTLDHFSFLTKSYKGVQLYIDTYFLSSEKENVLKSFGIDCEQLKNIYSANKKAYHDQISVNIKSVMNNTWSVGIGNFSLLHLQLRVIELLYALLQGNERQTLYTGFQIEIAKKAEQILTANLHKHYPIKQIAEQLSVSETSLKNYFRSVYGQNISSYLRDTRLDAAERLLVETQKPISEISAQVGYTNQGNFAGLFKNKFGMTPSEYRRAKRLEKV